MSLALGVDAGSGPLVVLLHGFPELPGCWSAQVGPLVEAGYRVVAPALRGYADSLAPPDPAEYTADRVADDIAGVIEECGAEQAAVIGHDWGAAVTWATAELRPERVAALAALSVPFTARSLRPPLEQLAARMAGHFFYMLYFNEPDGRADRELAADTRRFLLGCYLGWSAAPPRPLASLPPGASMLDQLPPTEGGLPAWLDPAGFEADVATFTRTGFTGALNYYRAMDLTWHAVPAYGTEPVRCPALFVAGEADPTLAFIPTRAMAAPLVPDLRGDVRVPGAGHWVQREAPDVVTRTLLDYLAEVWPARR